MLAPPLPWPARVLNAAGRALRHGGQELVELDVPGMLEEARRQAQADDFGEPDFMPALHVLIESAHSEMYLCMGRDGMLCAAHDTSGRPAQSSDERRSRAQRRRRYRAAEL